MARRQDIRAGSETKIVILTARTLCRVPGEGHPDGQEAEDRSAGRKHVGHGLQWGFHRKESRTE